MISDREALRYKIINNRIASPGQIKVNIGETAVGFRTVTGADDT